MKVQVERTMNVEYDIATVRLELAVRHGDDDMPDDFPFRKGEMWRVDVDANTGRIKDWPKGLAHELYMKVVDCGTYTLLDPTGAQLAIIENDYVPHGVVPGKYGDYVDLKINEDGVITNWPKRFDIEAFFRN